MSDCTLCTGPDADVSISLQSAIFRASKYRQWMGAYARSGIQEGFRKTPEMARKEVERVRNVLAHSTPPPVFQNVGSSHPLPM